MNIHSWNKYFKYQLDVCICISKFFILDGLGYPFDVIISISTSDFNSFLRRKSSSLNFKCLFIKVIYCLFYRKHKIMSKLFKWNKIKITKNSLISYLIKHMIEGHFAVRGVRLKCNSDKKGPSRPDVKTKKIKIKREEILFTF